jgi:signal transduction histidine kinase
MGRLRLRTQLLVATFLIICALTGALVFIVRYTVRSEIAKQVRESTDASLLAFENVQRERDLQLSRTAALLAELPTLKAAMTTEHPLTIQDASEPFWKLAGSDLFLLAKPNGELLGFHVSKPGWNRDLSTHNLKNSLQQGEDAAWWYADGQLYRVFLRPITAGIAENQRQLGILAIGYQIDSTVAKQLAAVSGGEIALATGEKIIASTFSKDEEAELQRWIQQNLKSNAGAGELSLGPDQYQVSSILIQSGPPTPVKCYVLMSLQPSNSFIQRLNRTIFVLAISAVVLAALLLGFVSRTITHPLDNLVSGVRALAAGDYTYTITPRGSSEVAELSEAFSKMRGELRTSQQQQLAIERIAAFGTAASSISHDLRHYLAAVVANAEFLYEAEKLKLNKDEIYDEIKTASDQMIDLLDSLRELGREDGYIAPVPGFLDQSVRRAIESVRARPELRSRAISISTSGDMNGVFDPRKLERAFFNLLLNACEATGQSQGQIKVEVTSLEEVFEIRVADNGTGVPESIRSTLFNPFVSSGKTNGTGLGLAIVSKIVHDHGGRATVEHTSGAGTIFLVKLPRSTGGPVVTDRATASSDKLNPI